MILGHYIIKKYRSLNGQGLGTRFIIVGIPLIPIQSFYFLDKKKSFEVDLYWRQVVKIYMIMISIIILCFMFGSNAGYYSNHNTFKVKVGLLVLVNVLVLYFLDFYPKKDKQIRLLLEDAVGINALPKFLGHEMAYNIQKGFIQSFGGNWKDKILSKEYSLGEVPLLFSIAVYEQYLFKSEKNQKMVDLLFNEYSKIKNLN
ncbi:hypothetical protein [Soonwooa sp.]|uniref:hypothetical protein n=1 Tax=Soonwooa sp. TaxID=1938592 RepID=UPI00262E6C7F|nr:hypothetical protein [Soonwooa sp.]